MDRFTGSRSEARHGQPANFTPLYLATDNRNIEGSEYLVRVGDMDHLEFIQRLLDHKADPNLRAGNYSETRTSFTMQWLNEDGATPFLRAAQSGDTALMKLLLAHGADPNIKTKNDTTALEVAADIGWVEDITFEWSPGETFEAVKMCFDLGSDVNAADNDGRTALMGAAHKGRNDVIQLLLNHIGGKLPKLLHLPNFDNLIVGGRASSRPLDRFLLRFDLNHPIAAAHLLRLGK